MQSLIIERFFIKDFTKFRSEKKVLRGNIITIIIINIITIILIRLDESGRKGEQT